MLRCQYYFKLKTEKITMTVQEVINYFGNAAKAAQHLGLNKAAVRMWKFRGRVPSLQQYKIEIITNGYLKADKNEIIKKEQ